MDQGVCLVFASEQVRLWTRVVRVLPLGGCITGGYTHKSKAKRHSNKTLAFSTRSTSAMEQQVSAVEIVGDDGVVVVVVMIAVVMMEEKER